MDYSAAIMGLVLVICSVFYHLYTQHLNTLTIEYGLIGIDGSKSRRNKRRFINYLTVQGEVDCPTLQSELYILIRERDALRVRDYYRIFLDNCFNSDNENERIKLQNYFEVFFEEYGASIDEETLKNTRFNRYIGVDSITTDMVNCAISTGKMQVRSNELCESKEKLNSDTELIGGESPKSVSVRLSLPEVSPRTMKSKNVIISDSVQYFKIE